jgi:hypothetical protein
MMGAYSVHLAGALAAVCGASSSRTQVQLLATAYSRAQGVSWRVSCFRAVLRSAQADFGQVSSSDRPFVARIS